jgi:hypothetical protein
MAASKLADPKKRRSRSGARRAATSVFEAPYVELLKQSPRD